ncbi:MAG: DUF2071 domain-containing protein, partial [Acidobacteriota bacterium]|nr:DUF2071 domain-containing protein [Acidobacteriota bacterium]
AYSIPSDVHLPHRRGEPSGEERRGGVFIREFVPRAAITLIANALYQEPYATLPTTPQVEGGEVPVLLGPGPSHDPRNSLWSIAASLWQEANQQGKIEKFGTRGRAVS